MNSVTESWESEFLLHLILNELCYLFIIKFIFTELCSFSKYCHSIFYSAAVKVVDGKKSRSDSTVKRGSCGSCIKGGKSTWRSNSVIDRRNDNCLKNLAFSDTWQIAFKNKINSFSKAQFIHYLFDRVSAYQNFIGFY